MRHLVACLLLACVACTGDDGEETFGHESEAGEAGTTDGDEPSYSGEHVVVYADPGLELCAGTMAHMDDFIARMAARLAVEVPVVGDRIRMTWVADDQRLASYCADADGILGCADTRVYSTQAPLNHEFVHVLSLRRTGTYPTAFFSEGLANAHEGYGASPVPTYFYTETDTPITDLIGRKAHDLGGGGYESAGRFAAYLVDRHGLARYLDLYVALADAGSDTAAIDAAFLDVLGTGIAASIDEFSAQPMNRNYDPLLSECGAPEIAWDGVTLEMAEMVSCAAPRAVGPYAGSAMLPYTITVPADAVYELRLTGDDGEAAVVPDVDIARPFVGVSISTCTPGAGSFAETRVGGTPRTASLSAGVYSLRLIATVDAPPTELSFTLQRVE